MQLGRVAEIHRLAGVNERVEVQVLLLLKQLQKQLVQPGIEVPIDQPQIVSGNVIAKVMELDALALAFALAFPLHPPAKYFSRNELEALEPRKHFRTEQGSGWTRS